MAFQLLFRRGVDIHAKTLGKASYGRTIESVNPNCRPTGADLHLGVQKGQLIPSHPRLGKPQGQGGPQASRLPRPLLGRRREGCVHPLPHQRNPARESCPNERQGCGLHREEGTPRTWRAWMHRTHDRQTDFQPCRRRSRLNGRMPLAGSSPSWPRPRDNHRTGCVDMCDRHQKRSQPGGPCRPGECSPLSWERATFAGRQRTPQNQI